jgi:hypothetical protein
LLAPVKNIARVAQRVLAENVQVSVEFIVVSSTRADTGRGRG